MMRILYNNLYTTNNNQISYRGKTKALPSNITKEEVLKLLQQGLAVPKICERYNITAYAYYKFANEVGIKNPKKAVVEKNASIREQELREKINLGLTVKQICKALDITQAGYFSLINKFGIQTPRKQVLTHNSTITKEQIEELLQSGMPYNEILEKLNITSTKYLSMLSEFGITTVSKERKAKISSITKEQLETLLKNKKSVKEICKELEIPERTYSRLIDKFGIVTERKLSKNNIASITKEDLQNLIDSGFSRNEICQKLNITLDIFYKLLKRLNINYNYMNHSNEIIISSQKLSEMAASGKKIEEITKELGIAQTTYSEKTKVAGIKTMLRDSIDDITSIPIKKLQELISCGVTIQEICKTFNITKANYTALIRKYNLQTAQRKSENTISKITPMQLLELRAAGKSIEEICKELNISKSSYRRIINTNSKI